MTTYTQLHAERISIEQAIRRLQEQRNERTERSGSDSRFVLVDCPLHLLRTVSDPNFKK